MDRVVPEPLLLLSSIFYDFLPLHLCTTILYHLPTEYIMATMMMFHEDRDKVSISDIIAFYFSHLLDPNPYVPGYRELQKGHLV